MSFVSGSRVILHVIEMTHQRMRITKENLYSTCEPHHKLKQGPQDIAQHKPYLKIC